MNAAGNKKARRDWRASVGRLVILKAHQPRHRAAAQVDVHHQRPVVPRFARAIVAVIPDSIVGPSHPVKQRLDVMPAAVLETGR